MSDLGGPERVQRTMTVLDKYAGTVPGFRRAHARGIGFRGRFTPAPEAAAVTTAEHFQGPAVPVVVRLSNGSANPYQVDRASPKNGSVLGLGVRFELASGEVAAWAALSVNAFPAAKPDDFIGMTSAQRRNPKSGYPNLLRRAPFLVTHPQCVRGAKEIVVLGATKSFAPRSSTACTRTTSSTPRDGGGRFATAGFRWPAWPGSPSRSTGSCRRSTSSARSSCACRAKPAAWDLVFQLAEPDDPVDDMTKQWPEDRPLLTAGRLVIDRLHEDPELLDGLIFDPTRVPPGIELSDDPVLHFRSES